MTQPTRPRYAVVLRRLKDREKALLAELEDVRAAIYAIQYATNLPESLVADFRKAWEKDRTRAYATESLGAKLPGDPIAWIDARAYRPTSPS